MTENFHKWYSQWIGEDFRMLVFGETGIPLVIFPPADSRYYDYKDFGVIESLRQFIEEGSIKVYCPDSYDKSSWQNFEITPEERVEKYLQFEQTILHDIVGFAHYETEDEKIIFSGFEFGAYHALNILLKHPGLARGLITIAGDFEVKKFVHGYFDDQVYYNSPLDYFFGLNEKEFIEKYRKQKLILCTGSPDETFDQNRYISKLMFEKSINHLFDVYPHKLNTFEDCKDLLNKSLPYFIM